MQVQAITDNRERREQKSHAMNKTRTNDVSVYTEFYWCNSRV
jgi:hypothetical protein